MATARLTVNLEAIADNWRRLNRLSADATETAAVVKADGYGLGASEVARTLLRCGASTFFVALAEEGARLRRSMGGDAEIFVLSGYSSCDAQLVSGCNLIPVINSAEQFRRHGRDLPRGRIAIQLDTGMNRLGMEAEEFCSIRESPGGSEPVLIMSHLACADEPSHPQNQSQLKEFLEMTEGMRPRRSLSATGGILLGPDFHFDLCRAGIGLYGGLPHRGARQVVQLDLPVIQVRHVQPGESVGYGGTWIAESNTRVATVSAGYADGIFRSLGGNLTLYAGDVPCRSVGRISMDLITVDVSHIRKVPESLQLLGSHQTIDDLADCASTIGYEILTSLGNRYERVHEIE